MGLMISDGSGGDSGDWRFSRCTNRIRVLRYSSANGWIESFVFLISAII